MSPFTRNHPALSPLAVALGLALSVPFASGCNDHARTGSGTGGQGAGSASDAPGVVSPTAAGSGTTADGTPTDRGAGSTHLPPSDPSQGASGTSR